MSVTSNPGVAAAALQGSLAQKSAVPAAPAAPAAPAVSAVPKAPAIKVEPLVDPKQMRENLREAIENLNDQV